MELRIYLEYLIFFLHLSNFSFPIVYFCAYFAFLFLLNYLGAMETLFSCRSFTQEC